MFILRLLRERHDDEVFEVVQVAPTTTTSHVLATHAEDIRSSTRTGSGPDRPGAHAFVMVKGDETVGRCCSRDGDVAHIELDYVTPKYRDFSPGEFVWRRSGVLQDLGITHVRTSPVALGDYYEHVGFHRNGETYELDL